MMHNTLSQPLANVRQRLEHEYIMSVTNTQDYLKNLNLPHSRLAMAVYEQIEDACHMHFDEEDDANQAINHLTYSAQFYAKHAGRYYDDALLIALWVAALTSYNVTLDTSLFTPAEQIRIRERSHAFNALFSDTGITDDDPQYNNALAMYKCYASGQIKLSIDDFFGTEYEDIADTENSLIHAFELAGAKTISTIDHAFHRFLENYTDAFEDHTGRYPALKNV